MPLTIASCPGPLRSYGRKAYALLLKLLMKLHHGRFENDATKRFDERGEPSITLCINTHKYWNYDSLVLIARFSPTIPVLINSAFVSLPRLLLTYSRLSISLFNSFFPEPLFLHLWLISELQRLNYVKNICVQAECRDINNLTTTPSLWRLW